MKVFLGIDLACKAEHRASLVGADGATHCGAFDLAYLCTLPNFTVMAAADEAELCHMVHTMALHDSGPIAVRYPRGEGRGVSLPEEPKRLEIGKGRIIREGKSVAILSLGTRLAEAEKAAAALKDAQPVIDSLVNKNVIHRNKAARHKSALSARIKAL